MTALVDRDEVLSIVDQYRSEISELMTRARRKHEPARARLHLEQWLMLGNVAVEIKGLSVTE